VQKTALHNVTVKAANHILYCLFQRNMPYVEYTRGTDVEEMRREDSGGEASVLAVLFTHSGWFIWMRPQLIIISQAVIYWWKWNVAGSYLSRCGHIWVTENVEITFLSPGYSGQRGAPCAYTFFCYKSCEVTDWKKLCNPGRHHLSTAKYTVLPSSFSSVNYSVIYND
jgi:hypothetical protein